ncbi:DNA translocase FtsK [Candidatus Finniella inopinata]|uniref:DNA translocase FtsK n=1 Tax=Candidatus Finniella inopinata TaxID=1696036 RepID=A0A4Q7DG52_9PROT|nr:DNA translocase FtsK [Candidatus Finniella inopinata]RZI45821.1 DNA translocase FtsK [Candidatus Finniella inopinata]
MIFGSSRQFLPNAAKAFLKKSFKQLVGLCLLVATVVSLVCFLGYNPKDPSLNTATDSGTITNWLGQGGALVADVITQLFGYSGLLAFFIIACWGWKFWRQPDFTIPSFRILNGLIAVISFSIFLNGWFTWKSWKIIHAGGALGCLLVNALQSLFRAWSVLAFFKPFLWAVGFMSLALAWYAAGLSWTSLRGFVHMVIRGVQKISNFVGRTVLKTNWVKKSDVLIKKSSQTLPPWLKGLETAESRFIQPIPSFSEEEPLDEFVDDVAFDEEVPQPVKPLRKKVSAAPSAEEILASRGHSDEYQLPTLDLLDPTSSNTKNVKMLSQESLESASKQLHSVLEEFGIRGEIVNIRPGPVVTMYELKPAAGIKTSRVIGLADDIARSMSALSVRIAVIPGQNVIGIELPNPYRQTVYLRELLSSPEYQQLDKGLPLILGKDIGGQPSIADLTRMPHLLVAGTTGSGKSVSINTMILSLLYKFSPERCKFIMIDPKMLELSIYDDIPHLLTPVVTDAKKAVVALKWAVKEMENRYRAMAKLSVRNVDGFNARLAEARKNGELLMRRVQTGFDPDSGKPTFENQPLDFAPLPYIVVVVDEMADLMLVAGKEIEMAVQRLAQMARAAGIHLIMATQRPSVDVITGTIKANFPTRISFQVTSKIDSRTILGEQGAEQLLGQGDMLYMAGGGRISRVHGPFIRDEEVERIVKFLKLQGEPSYLESITEDEEGATESGEGDDKGGGNDLYRQAMDLVLSEGKVSTSFIQRHLQIGYNRAARIVDQMEKAGVISAANHVGKREILK